MSKKGIFVALSLAVAQLFVPVARHAVAQTPGAKPDTVYMNFLAEELDVALDRAIVLGRYKDTGLTETAQALGVAALDPGLVESLYKKDDQIRAHPQMREGKSETIKKVFNKGGLHGSSSEERGNVRFLATYLGEIINEHAAAVDAYCGEESSAKRRPDSALCKDLGLLKSRNPSADNE